MLIATYAIGLAALLVSAVAIFRTFCEGFGCLGIGILWMAWAGAYVAWLLLGFIVQARKKRKPDDPRGSSPLVRRLLVGQILLGVALLLYWGLHTLH